MFQTALGKAPKRYHAFYKDTQYEKNYPSINHL
jgi:hypothetical protein